jgi:hypothetical protein
MNWITRVPKLVTYVLLTCLLAIGNVQAGLITISANNVGAIISIDANSPEQAAGFELGELLLLYFTVSNSLADVDSAIGDGKFNDPNGTITLTGLTSGATMTYFGGVQIQVDDIEEFEIDTLQDEATALVTSILEGDIDFNTEGTAFFTNPDSLTAVLADLLGSSFLNASDNEAYTEYWNGTASVEGMRFGPSSDIVIFTNNSVDIPEPSTLAIFAIGLMGLTSRLKRNTN